MLPIHDYLKYNNIALIDPSQNYHAGCIDFYDNNGYLSMKQLAKLREWCHSSEAIERLTSVPEQPTAPSDDFWTPFDVEPEVPTVTKARWTSDDDENLRTALAQEPSTDQLLAIFPERTESSLKARVYKLGGFYRKGKYYLG